MEFRSSIGHLAASTKVTYERKSIATAATTSADPFSQRSVFTSQEDRLANSDSEEDILAKLRPIRSDKGRRITGFIARIMTEAVMALGTSELLIKVTESSVNSAFLIRLCCASGILVMASAVLPDND